MIPDTDSDKQFSEHEASPSLSDKETMTVTMRLYRHTPTDWTACNNNEALYMAPDHDNRSRHKWQ